MDLFFPLPSLHKTRSKWHWELQLILWTKKRAGCLMACYSCNSCCLVWSTLQLFLDVHILFFVFLFEKDIPAFCNHLPAVINISAWRVLEIVQHRLARVMEQKYLCRSGPLLAPGGQQNKASPHSPQDNLFLAHGAFLWTSVFQNYLCIMISTEMKQLGRNRTAWIPQWYAHQTWETGAVVASLQIWKAPTTRNKNLTC